MRKVGVRCIWNKLNDGYGCCILPRMKHNVYEILSAYISDVNCGATSSRSDLCSGLCYSLPVYFKSPSESTHICGLLTQWIFDQAERK